MDDSNDPLSPRTPGASDEDLREQVQSLRSVQMLLLVAMTCVSAWLSLFLYRQVVNSNRQLTEARRMTEDFQTNALPKINWFVGNLQAFARTNADFNPILAKYNLLQTGAPPATGIVPPKK